MSKHIIVLISIIFAACITNKSDTRVVMQQSEESLTLASPQQAKDKDINQIKIIPNIALSGCDDNNRLKSFDIACGTEGCIINYYERTYQKQASTFTVSFDARLVVNGTVNDEWSENYEINCNGKSLNKVSNAENHIDVLASNNFKFISSIKLYGSNICNCLN